MGEIIGNSLSDLKSLTKKCYKKGGTPNVRTRFVRKFRTKVIFTCYGPEKGKIPGGTVKNLPEETVEELQEAESKTKKLLEIAGIKGKKGSKSKGKGE